MLPTKDDALVAAREAGGDLSRRRGSNQPSCDDEQTRKIWTRKRYTGTLLFNIGAFVLPALYLSLIHI